ncbi:hypothetical protein DL240_00665 [Lujinxingia litoralis]|uniref:Uncharacterized protein n=1 Tax=Lujinxingia litoralis TaxID=2211119 RepID=A0A328C8J6_9DELT|nr:hypothetical protein [Lujinxingia litoralis]RAL24755.1 hypothetical protein DL240_00665 [Lujinxingia litoralis]
MSHQGREVRQALSARLLEVIAEFSAHLPEGTIAAELSRLGGDLRVNLTQGPPATLPEAQWSVSLPGTLEVRVVELAGFERIWRAVLTESRFRVRALPTPSAPPERVRLFAPCERGSLTLRVRRSRIEAQALLLEVERPGLATRLRGEELRRALGATTRSERTSLPAPPPPPENDLETIAPTYQVQLEQRSFCNLLREHLEDPRAGYLRVTQPRRTTTFLVAERAVWEVWQAPHPESIALSTLLLRGGQLDAPQLARATRLASEQNIPLEAALLELNLLSPRRLALTRRARILYALDPTGTQWERGLASFHPLPEAPALDPSTRVELGTHLFARTFKKTLSRAPEDLKHSARALGPGPFSLQERPGLQRRQLGATPQATPVVRALSERPQPLAQLLESGDPPELIAATLLTLADFDLLRYSTPDTRHALSGNDIFGHDALHRHAVLRMAARADADDHFAYLDLHWSAYTQLVQRAYLRLREQVLAASLPPDEEPLKERVLHRLDHAHDVLAIPAQRACYRAEIIDNWTCQTTLEALRERLDEARESNDLAHAFDLARRVLELAPDCASTRALVANLRASQVQREVPFCPPGRPTAS